MGGGYAADAAEESEDPSGSSYKGEVAEKRQERQRLDSGIGSMEAAVVMGGGCGDGWWRR